MPAADTGSESFLLRCLPEKETFEFCLVREILRGNRAVVLEHQEPDIMSSFGQPTGQQISEERAVSPTCLVLALSFESCCLATCCRMCRGVKGRNVGHQVKIKKAKVCHWLNELLNELLCTCPSRYLWTSPGTLLLFLAPCGTLQKESRPIGIAKQMMITCISILISGAV